MSLDINITDAFSLIAKVCKEKEYQELQDALYKSYSELLKVEAKSRRKKASVLIKGMQIIDRELKILNFEYDKVKLAFNIDGIPYFDQFIAEVMKIRNMYAFEKNNKLK